MKILEQDPRERERERACADDIDARAAGPPVIVEENTGLFQANRREEREKKKGDVYACVFVVESVSVSALAKVTKKNEDAKGKERDKGPCRMHCT